MYLPGGTKSVAVDFKSRFGSAISETAQILSDAAPKGFKQVSHG
jgi:hypothetical protein